MNETELRKYLIDEINRKATRIFYSGKDIKTKLDDVEFEKETIKRQIEYIGILPEERGVELNWILDDMSVENETNAYIKQAVEYIDREYEKGKYEGRELSSLFGCLFALIGPEAHAKFNAAR